MSELLTVENLGISFPSEEGKTAVVQGLSFDVSAGETLAIVGESGSGKSMSSLAIMGLLPKNAIIDNGSIQLQQEEESIELIGLPNKPYRKIRGKDIAMVFQEPMTSLNPVIKCGEQVEEAIRLHKNYNKKKAKAEVLKWFEEVQLPRVEQIYDSYPHQISGGQKQRVMLAMAMSCNPRLLIADEPTTALDVTVQKRILELIQKLKDKHGMGVIFITHDLGVVAEIADKVLVMQKGKKVEEGSTAQIFENPQMPYTKGLLACRPPLDYRLKRLPTVADFLQVSDSNQSFEEIKIGGSERKQQLNDLFQQAVQLDVRGLKTYFPIKKGIFSRVVDYVKAVDDVSFQVYQGETLGLVGESGCGKTTLGRSILNLIKPTAGEVLFEGKNIAEVHGTDMRSLRKDLQIIFQDPYSSLNPRIRIGDAILEPLHVHNIGSNHKERKEKVVDLMETVGLQADHYSRYPHEFSGGQRQRICIARSLALSPKFIICDESVSALDVSVQAQVLNLLNDLKNKYKFTYIFISHDLSVVKYMSDRMLVMQAGKVVESGIAEEIYANPKETYTKKLIEAIPKVKFRTPII